MFFIEKKGEWLASVDLFETALQVARSYGKNTQVRRTRDGALCGGGCTDECARQGIRLNPRS